MRESYTVQRHQYFNHLDLHARVWGNAQRHGLDHTIGPVTYDRLHADELALSYGWLWRQDRECRAAGCF